MRTTSARCISRSINETTQAALGKTSPHSAKARFVVRIGNSTVAVGTGIAPRPHTDPYVRHYRIRLLP